MPYITYNESGTNQKFVKDNNKYVTGNWPSGSITMTYSAVAGTSITINMYNPYQEKRNDIVLFDWGDGSPLESWQTSHDNLNPITHLYSITENVIITVSGIRNSNDIIINGQLGAYDSITSLNMSESYTSLEKIYLSNHEQLQTLTFPSTLTRLNTVELTSCTSINSVIIPEQCASINRISISYTLIETVTLYSAWKQLNYIRFLDNSNITSLIIPEGMTSLKSVYFTFCNSLSYVSLPNDFPAVNGCNMGFAGCGINSEENIEQIFVRLDNSGTTNGSALFYGGTNAAPNAIALNAINSLRNKGWIVYHN